MEGKHWHVLTGGPGSGKTTTLLDMAGRGHATVPEVARRLFEEQFRAGKTFADIDMNEFERLNVDAQLAQESKLIENELAFLDRGVVDVLAYCRYFKLEEPARLHAAITNAPYNKVFLLDLVNVEKDDVRQETRAEAETLHQLLSEVYREHGFEVIPVPVLPILERSDFILDRVR